MGGTVLKNPFYHKAINKCDCKQCNEISRLKKENYLLKRKLDSIANTCNDDFQVVSCGCSSSFTVTTTTSTSWSSSD